MAAKQLLDDGTIPLAADWDVGAFNVSSEKPSTTDKQLIRVVDTKTLITTATTGLAKTTEVNTAISTAITPLAKATEVTTEITNATKDLVKKDGSVAFTAPIVSPAPTADGHLTNKKYVDDKVAAGGGVGGGSLPIGSIIQAFSPYDNNQNATIKDLNSKEFLICDGSQLKKTEHKDFNDYLTNVLKGDFYTQDGFSNENSQDADYFTLPYIKPISTDSNLYKFKLYSYIKVKK